MKTCTKCNEAKPLDGFYVQKSNRDGRRGTCKECHKTTCAKWRLAHPETCRAYGVKKRLDHPEACRAYFTKWRKAHLEKAKAISRASVAKYQDANPERVRATNRISVAKWGKAHPEANSARRAKRRAFLLAYEGLNYTAADVAALLIDQHDLCAYCGIVLNGKYHVDHVVPLSQDGGNGSDNICLTCAPCNLSKGGKSLLVWAMALGRDWQSPRLDNGY